MDKRFVIIILFTVMVLSGFAQTRDGTVLFKQAKLLLFDRQWDQALKVLDEFMESFPKSDQYSLALFYKGKCLEEKKQYLKSLESYHSFLEISLNKSLKEEATVAIIDVYFNLYQTGKENYLEKLMNFLNSNQRNIQYYAAFKLSYAKDKRWAKKAVPILKKLLNQEKDDELKDRARIALMRIDPDSVRKLSQEKSPETRLLHIQVFDKKLRKETFTLTIPLLLGKLALESIPQKEKSSLKRKGYNIDELLTKLTDSGDLIKIDDEDSVFKIWID